MKSTSQNPYTGFIGIIGVFFFFLIQFYFCLWEKSIFLLMTLISACIFMMLFELLAFKIYQKNFHFSRDLFLKKRPYW